MAQTHAITASTLGWSQNIVSKNVNIGKNRWSASKATLNRMHFNKLSLTTANSSKPPKEEEPCTQLNTLLTFQGANNLDNNYSHTGNLNVRLHDALRRVPPPDTSQRVGQTKHMMFMYSALKHGGRDHWVLQNAIATGHAKYVGMATTKLRFPVVVGIYSLTYMMNFPGSVRGDFVRGELYELDDVVLELVDHVLGVKDKLFMRRTIVATNIEYENEVIDEDLLVETVVADPMCTHGLQDYLGTPDVERPMKGNAILIKPTRDKRQDDDFHDKVQCWLKTQETTDDMKPTRSRGNAATLMPS